MYGSVDGLVLVLSRWEEDEKHLLQMSAANQGYEERPSKTSPSTNQKIKNQQSEFNC